MAVLPARLGARWPLARTKTWDLPIALLAVAIFAGDFATRRVLSNSVDADELVPVAVLALRFGRTGGLVGAFIAVALTGAWELGHADATVAPIGYLSRGLAFVVLGIVLGSFMDHRRRLEAELLRYFEESLDLLATLDSTARFTRVNPAWETVLGHTRETLCGRPFIEFVHPDDRDTTIAESEALKAGTHDTFRFRNRYRASDGTYRWLEWSAHPSRRDSFVHAVARDISTQVAAEEQLASTARALEATVVERTDELSDAHAETLRRLTLAGKYRDDETVRHTERVAETAAEIANQLGLDAEQVTLLRDAAPLHDIGKLAIPDRILLKGGHLTIEEREVMQNHTEMGGRLLSGSRSPVMQMATLIATSHHERWDGSGYPAGLAGEAIPLVGRIVAIADVFDALTHERPYKDAWPLEQALAEVKRGAGRHFDPRIVAAFIATPAIASLRSSFRFPQALLSPGPVAHSPAAL